MQETFKNVSIFLVFLASLLLWNAARGYLRPYFAFSHGETVLLCLWSVCVVIIFHLLYFFLGRLRHAHIYLSTMVALLAVGTLVYLQKLPLS